MAQERIPSVFKLSPHKEPSAELPSLTENRGSVGDSLSPLSKPEEINSRLRILSKAQGVRRLSIANSARNEIAASTSNPSNPSTEESSDKRTPSQETGRLLSFRQSSSRTPSFGGDQMEPRPPISILGILAAKKVSQKFMEAITGATKARRMSKMRKISSISSSSFSVRVKPPTYQLGPNEPFDPLTVQPKVQEIVAKRTLAAGPKYNADAAASLCKRLTNEVKLVMRSTLADRYRYIVLCVVRQRSDQTACLCSRTLWDQKTDKWLSAEYTTPAMHVFCVAYAVYKE